MGIYMAYGDTCIYCFSHGGKSMVSNNNPCLDEIDEYIYILMYLRLDEFNSDYS